MRRFRSAAFMIALGALLAPATAAATTESFNYTGAVQSWVVPLGVTSATFDIYGAEGQSIGPGDGIGGLGGRATATLPVTPGETIEIRVGGSGAAGGFNGGGTGLGANGGGATDVRRGGSALADRALVAGGGGGTGNCSDTSVTADGGAGGGLSGGDATDPNTGGCSGTTLLGKGGTQTQGGDGGAGGQPGTLGQGGNGAAGYYGVGGGGGGYYGGGGGGVTGQGANRRGGGGGSGFGPSGTTFETGVRTGSGTASVTYTQRFDLTATTSGTGVGRATSSPAGIDCRSGSPTGCTATYDPATQVTLTAAAESGSTFTGWSGGGCSGTEPCTVTLDAAKSVDAAFTANATPPPPITPDDPPVITSLEVTPRSFAPGPDPVKPKDLGATLKVGLSENANVKFRVRRSPARKSGGPGSTARVFARDLAEGESSLPFSGTFRKTLKPGRYQVIAVATDSAGQTSEKARAEFSVKY